MHSWDLVCVLGWLLPICKLSFWCVHNKLLLITTLRIYWFYFCCFWTFGSLYHQEWDWEKVALGLRGGWWASSCWYLQLPLSSLLSCPLWDLRVSLSWVLQQFLRNTGPLEVMTSQGIGSTALRKPLSSVHIPTVDQNLVTFWKTDELLDNLEL